MELRRRGWFGNDHELVDGSTHLATLSYRVMRSEGEIRLADGSTWSVTRAAGFGPWELRDETGEVRASITKQDAFRERFTVDVGGADRWEIDRRSNLGQRLWMVTAAPGGAAGGSGGEEVGSVRQRGFSARVHELRLPTTEDEPLALVAWVVGLMAIRDASA